LQSYEKRFGHIFTTDSLPLCAMLLDPRYSHSCIVKYKLDANVCTDAVARLVDDCIDFFNNDNNGADDDQTVNDDDLCELPFLNNNNNLPQINFKTRISNDINSVIKLLNKYWNRLGYNLRESMDESILRDFWTASSPCIDPSHYELIRLLAPFAAMMLSVQASSAASETVFSASGFLQNNRRTCLSPGKLEQLTVIKFNTSHLQTSDDIKKLCCKI
jgi:hypothetical protein